LEDLEERLSACLFVELTDVCKGEVASTRGVNVIPELCKIRSGDSYVVLNNESVQFSVRDLSVFVSVDELEGLDILLPLVSWCVCTCLCLLESSDEGKEVLLRSTDGSSAVFFEVKGSVVVCVDVFDELVPLLFRDISSCGSD
jgi:hypothetical protein